MFYRSRDNVNIFRPQQYRKRRIQVGFVIEITPSQLHNYGYVLFMKP